MFGLDLNSPGDGGAVGDEVGDGLHDVPAVLPPGQSRQDPELTNNKRVLTILTNHKRVLPGTPSAPAPPRSAGWSGRWRGG